MTRAWLVLVFVVLLSWQPTPTFAQGKLQVTVKSCVVFETRFVLGPDDLGVAGLRAVFTPDGKTLVGIGEGDPPRSVVLVDATTGKEKATFLPHP